MILPTVSCSVRNASWPDIESITCSPELFGMSSASSSWSRSGYSRSEEMPASVTRPVMRPSAARDAAAAAADVVVVHHARQHDVGVRVEAAGQLLAVVLEVRLDRVLPARERVLVVLVAAVEPLRRARARCGS